MYPNLTWLMCLNGISVRMLAGMLGICRNSVTNKLFHRTQWKEREMLAIQKIIRPRLDLDTLFSPYFTLDKKETRRRRKDED